jgi:hypothetical protein
MTWLCGLRLVTLSLAVMFLTWTGFLVGFVRGVRHEGKRLRRRLMIAGSAFARHDD